MLWDCLFVGCGGFVGAVLRYLCGCLRVDGVPFPVITLGINVVGSFAIMFFAGALARAVPFDGHLMLFLRVGLCGGFTTFSTFSAETLALLEQGAVGTALLYALISLVLCVLAAYLGELASGFCAQAS